MIYKRAINPAATPDIIREIDLFVTDMEEKGTLSWMHILPEPVTGNFLLIASVV